MATLPNEVTQLLINWSNGDKAALDELVPLVQAELRRVARRYLAREHPGHTLQTSALINEAYLRLVDQDGVAWQNRAHFLGVAAHVMRRLLVDHARTRGRLKRGAGLNVPLDDVDVAGPSGLDVDLVALDAALDELATLSEQQSRIVELRYFGGLSLEETAEVMGVSTMTVKRGWAMARAWLHRELTGGEA